MTKIRVEASPGVDGPLLVVGGGELSLSWEVESRDHDWKDLTYHAIAEAPSPESREHFLEGLAGALGVPVPPERRDSPVTRVLIPYRAWHDETRYLMLGRPSEPIEIGLCVTGSTAELHSFTRNRAPDALGALAALAQILRAELSAAGETVRDELRQMDEVSMALLSPRGVGENDALLLAAGAEELSWGGRVALARLLSDWPHVPAIARALQHFLREAQTRAVRNGGAPEHEALVWAVAALSGADPDTLRRDPASLDRALQSVL